MLAADYEFIRYDETVPWKGPDEDLDHAITTLDQACIPLSAAETVAMLSRLWAMTKRQVMEPCDMVLAIRSYTDELGRFPAPAVCHALSAWPRTSKWWPTLFEIIEAMPWKERRVAEMRDVFRAVAKRARA